jgi:hypothetical protein
MSDIDSISKNINVAFPQGQVQPSEQIFVLTGSQLQDIITRTVQPFQDEVSLVKGIVASLEAKVSALEATQDILGDNQLIQLRLIADLRKVQEPQPLQRDRGEILRALILANGGKMLAKEARQKMHLGKNRFSELLKICDFIETKPYHLDKRQDVIILKSKLVPRN